MKTRWIGGMAVLGVAAALVMSGCSASSFLPEAKADPTRFFVLSAPAAGSAAERAENAPAIRLKPVELAGYLKSRPMIVRRDGNEVLFRDFARWGEPLDQGIARVLREGLLAKGAGEVILPSARGTGTEANFELAVRVLACEGEAAGGVNFRAAWELSPGGAAAGGGTARRGDFNATGVRWDGQNEATLAAALSEAVQGLAAEIAQAVQK